MTSSRWTENRKLNQEIQKLLLQQQEQSLVTNFSSSSGIKEINAYYYNTDWGIWSKLLIKQGPEQVMNEIEAKVQIMIYIVGIPIAFHLMNLQKTSISNDR